MTANAPFLLFLVRRATVSIAALVITAGVIISTIAELDTGDIGAGLELLGVMVLAVIAVQHLRQQAQEQMAWARREEALKNRIVGYQNALRKSDQEAATALAEVAWLRDRVTELDRRAALSILTAGVARQAFPPLATGLTVTCQLERDISDLRARLALGEIDNAQLLQFLTRASHSVELTARNLRRTNQVMRGFRQLADEGRDDDAHSFDLTSYVTDVMEGLSAELRIGRHIVSVHGPIGFMVRTRPGVLAYILTTLTLAATRYRMAEDAVREDKGNCGESVIIISIGGGEDTATLVFEDDGEALCDCPAPPDEPDLAVARRLVAERLNGVMRGGRRHGVGGRVTLCFPRLLNETFTGDALAGDALAGQGE